MSCGLVALLPFAPSKYGDRDFHTEAQALAGALQGSSRWSDVHIFRAPGPVLYYAGPYLLVPHGSPENRFWLAGFLWTVLWSIVAALLIRRAAQGFAGKMAGRISVLLLIANPLWAYYGFGINGEVQAFVGLAIAAFAWVRLRSREACWNQVAGENCRCRW